MLPQPALALPLLRPTRACSVIQSKSQKARQKQSAILGELQAGLAASVKALEASIGQEAKAAEGACTRRFEGIARHLQAKFEEIEALNQKYQQVGKAMGPATMWAQPAGSRRLIAAYVAGREGGWAGARAASHRGRELGAAARADD